MRGPVVLVVEDETPIRNLITAALRQQNMDVIPAANSEDAVRISRGANSISVLLADVDFYRGVNGIELAERIREQNPGIRVLMMSTFPDAKTLAEEKGFAFLPKPFTLAGLNRRIRELLATNPPQSRSSDPR